MALSNQQMVEGCRKHNAKAQRALYDELAPMCMGVCHRYIADRDEAQDLLQDGFVRIFEQIGRLRDPDKLRPWAYAVMVNTCVSYLRRAKRLRVMEDLAHLSMEPDEEALVPYSMADIRKAIDSLSERTRTAFNLCAIDGRSAADAAERMGTTEGNVRLLVCRARAILRQELEYMKEEQ
ncbi:MAG: sigma-70 family RNA polymerase sigma factor [Bacteroidales bacterium]|nr:sigma-70 family RNA polymerase sigma factor [Bacteroidales bacterium]